MPDQLPDPRLTPVQNEEEEEAWRKVIRVKQVTLGVVIILLALNLVGGTIFFLKIGDTIEAVRDTQEKGSPVLLAMDKVIDEVAEQADDIQTGTDASVATNKAILDCLEPTGKCYRENRQNSASQVLSINNVSILAAVCGPTVDPAASLQERYRQARMCVTDLVRKPPE